MMSTTSDFNYSSPQSSALFVHTTSSPFKTTETTETTENTPDIHTTSETITTVVAMSTTQSMASLSTIMSAASTTAIPQISNIFGQSIWFYIIVGAAVFIMMIVAGCIAILLQKAIKTKCKRNQRRQAPAAEAPESPTERPKTSAEDDENGYERIPVNYNRNSDSVAISDEKCRSTSGADQSLGYMSMNSTANTDTTRTYGKYPKKAIPIPKPPRKTMAASSGSSTDALSTNNIHENRQKTKPIPVLPTDIKSITSEGSRPPEIPPRLYADTKPVVPPRISTKPSAETDHSCDQKAQTMKSFRPNQARSLDSDLGEANAYPDTPQSYKNRSIEHFDRLANDIFASSTAQTLPRIENRPEKKNVHTNALLEDDGTITREFSFLNKYALVDDLATNSVHNPDYTPSQFTTSEKKKVLDTNKKMTSAGQYSDTWAHESEKAREIAKVFDESGYMWVSEAELASRNSAFEDANEDQDNIYGNDTSQLDFAASHESVAAQTPRESDGYYVMSGNEPVKQSRDMSGDSSVKKSRDSTFEIVLTVHRKKGKRPEVKDFVVR